MTAPKYNGRIILYFNSTRYTNIPCLYTYLTKAAKENLSHTFILSFFIRDCRGGKGERYLGRKALRWLFLNYPHKFMNIMHLIPEYGRWDDLLDFFPKILNLELINKKLLCMNFGIHTKEYKVKGIIKKYQLKIVHMFGDQLIKDREKMLKGKSISLCAKWAPTEGCSLDRKYKIVSLICKIMNWTLNQYRKSYITPLRAYLRIVESYMCAQDWDSIQYDKVPSCAIKRLKQVFAKHSPTEFNKWFCLLKKGKTKLNYKQLMPHELISLIAKNPSNILIEKQWKVLENKLKKLGVLKDSLVVIDTSGSMENWSFSNSFTPINVAIGLGLLISNTVQGLFHNKVITFSEIPTLISLPGGSLTERYNYIKDIPWGFNTNLQAVFDLILEKAKKYHLTQEYFPKKIFIFTDMSFDKAQINNTITNFQVIDKKFKLNGFDRPQLIFWDIKTGNDFPVSVNDENTVMLSGFSPSIVKTIISGENINHWTIIKETIESERYKKINDILNK